MQDDKDTNLALSTYQSEDLLEKLKILNYEQLLLQEYKMKPISRFYFVKSVNPGEQFYMFVLIAKWLCMKLGKTMDKTQESDDPNIVIDKIMKTLEEMDLPIDFAPNKLIRGAGSSCIYVLDSLASQVLKVSRISFQRPLITQEDETATEYLEDNAEIILERLEDEQNGGLSDDSDMDMEGGDTYMQLNWHGRPVKKNSEHLLETGEATIKDLISYQQQWREEFERVLPQLKVYVKADARDWRSHLSQMDTYKQTIDNHSDETLIQLKKLHTDFTYILEKVESREKHLNNELQSLIKEFKELSIELSNIQHAEDQIQMEMESLQTQLQEVMQENDAKKTQMEMRGQAMSDGSSVLQIKKAIVKLKGDISHLHLEVALLVNTVDQDILRQAEQYVDYEGNLTKMKNY